MTVPHITYVRGGKSGLQRAGCFLTGRRGDPTDSATENIPPQRQGLGIRGWRLVNIFTSP